MRAAEVALQAKSNPVLLAVLGSPSAGNEKFAGVLQESVLPKPGGVRIWNEGDPVPWSALKAYGRRSFAGLEVVLEGQWDPARKHTQYTAAMLGGGHTLSPTSSIICRPLISQVVSLPTFTHHRACGQGASSTYRNASSW